MTRGQTRRVLRPASTGPRQDARQSEIAKSPDGKILIRSRDPRFSICAAATACRLRSPSEQQQKFYLPHQPAAAAPPPHFEHRSWRLDRHTEPLLFQHGRGDAQPASHCLCSAEEESCMRTCPAAQSRSIAHTGLQSKTSNEP
ncbi:uncharacterized protein PAN0_010d4031 [Moesziomyces antarcticus]|uniref:Uncharacterized protein n=2 Tax=Pseudozyma antarctica TaxID=84753 RepID=A0A081CGL4_PSEA2|nr:uncharacterized protein PAN0_010d4031 [Moesziomyces antarcticus]GAK65810.1 hypothetical protein PAN0_010d4031 [Moesziomyces antarcticus]SPO45437.1 uncharacterized protein PSANT_03123 [Moesziomyces antarcticus]